MLICTQHASSEILYHYCDIFTQSQRGQLLTLFIATTIQTGRPARVGNNRPCEIARLEANIVDDGRNAYDILLMIMTYIIDPRSMLTLSTVVVYITRIKHTIDGYVIIIVGLICCDRWDLTIINLLWPSDAIWRPRSRLTGNGLLPDDTQLYFCGIHLRASSKQLP